MSSPAAAPALAAREASLPAPVRDDTPKFDRLARVYRWMEWLSFGPCLSRCRRAFLPQLHPARRALVLGDGDGRFTAALLGQNHHVLVDALDASPAMLHSLRRRAGSNAGRLHTEICDLREWSPHPAHGYDLIVSHFFLDCLTTPEVFALAERVTSAATPDARWIVSEFAVPHGAFGRWVARPVVTVLYRAFAVLTGLRVRRLPNHSAALRAAGFSVLQQRRSLLGLLVAQMWQRKPPQPAARGNDHPG